MKKLLLLILLISSGLCRAQNYQCLQSGVKHYFINGNNYLKGIRIDSVKTFADSTIYYPFHTPRGSYTTPPFTLDNNGGSWLGKRVLQLNDGTFIFDSYWNDSVIIKTQANVGENWVFYSDVSSLYYKATVVAIDTMTVLSSIDSVKIILITSENGIGPVHTDPVDSFRIILSKANGFVQIFDLFTFPYHKPDSLFRPGLDYFLDRSNMQYYDIGAVYPPNKIYSIFALTNFINPTQEQLYDWGLGDNYRYSQCSSTPFDCGYSGPYFYDTISSKTTLAHSITYSNGITTNDSTLLLDSMPEEAQNNLYYYFPSNTSFCLTSPSYIITKLPNVMNSTTYYYKLGIGRTRFDYEDYMEPSYVHYQLLSFTRYGSTSEFCHLDVPVASTRAAYFQLYPNPTTTELTIKASNTQPCTITLLNVMGQAVQTIHTNKQETTIDVSHLPAGVYNVSITDENGNRYNDKVVILH